MKTSPTPWSYVRNRNNPTCFVDDNNGRQVARAASRMHAVLIVEAVNAYEGLKADNERQRKALEAALEDFYAIEPHIPHVTEDLREKAIRDIEAALGGEG